MLLAFTLILNKVNVMLNDYDVIINDYMNIVDIFNKSKNLLLSLILTH